VWATLCVSTWVCGRGCTDTFGLTFRRRIRPGSHLHPFPLRPVPTWTRPHLHARGAFGRTTRRRAGFRHNGSRSESVSSRRRARGEYPASTPCGDGPARVGAERPRRRIGQQQTRSRERTSLLLP
jgi:hypothetical protein